MIRLFQSNTLKPVCFKYRYKSPVFSLIGGTKTKTPSLPLLSKTRYAFMLNPRGFLRRFLKL